MERLDTAHEQWDQSWRDRVQRDRWSEPEPVVVELMPEIRTRGGTRILDVGTGIGRHALAFARAGFAVTALDASRAGLDQLAATAEAEGLRVERVQAAFTALPVEDAGFDYVLAWNVIYHGDRDVVRTALAECRRVLRAGGWLQLTMLSKRNAAFGIGDEVRPDTYVDPTKAGDGAHDSAGDGPTHRRGDPPSDKAHPHFYVDAAGLTALLAEAGFATISLVDVDQQPPGGYHWVALAETAE